MEKLRRLRTDRGLSQAKLAARAELDPSTVNQIERGAREASPATLRKLADALDVGIAELLEDASPKQQRRSSQEPKLFNGSDLERRLHEFGNARDSLNGFCDYWEQRLATGGISRQEFDDLGATVTGWIPVLKDAMTAEWNEIVASGKRNHHEDFSGTGSEVLSMMVLSPPMERFLRLGEELAAAEREMYGQDIEAEKRRSSFEVLVGMRDTA